MKLTLSLLVILLMADACWSYDDCRWANWWNTFDKKGWSICHSDEYVTGFYRNNWTPADPISLLEEARCCKAPTPNQHTASTCLDANWWKTLDRPYRWAECPSGYFVQDLYRSSGNGVSNIEEARCCKPNTLRDEYGDCYKDSDVWLSFDRKGPSLCRGGYYLTGIYRGNCNHLYCIEMFRCCKMHA